MKRTPLRRTTPLRRAIFKRTTKPRRHSDSEVLEQFKAEHTFCWRCGTNGTRWNPLDIHHIARLRRWDERTNLARLCRACHDLHHRGKGFDLADVIELKAKFDPAGYDAARLQELLLRRLP